MPPSQLKKLKTTLRETGVLGPQKSKKQKKQLGKYGAGKDGQIRRSTALADIREQSNPFDIRASARQSKHAVISRQAVDGRVGKGNTARPALAKALGEANRRKTLLVEMQRRGKVGGFIDRRFGENDPSMNPEDRAMERFVQEKQRGSTKAALFSLEDDNEGEELTHLGQSLSFDKPVIHDDYEEINTASSDQSDLEDREERPSKRRRLSEDNELPTQNGLVNGGDQHQDRRSKTKKEIMEEVIAKSKLHKYERQKAKEDDDDLRAELDKGLPDLYAVIRGKPTLPLDIPIPKIQEAHRQINGIAHVNGKSENPGDTARPSHIQDSAMNPDRLALLQGKDRSQADKEYDQRLRQMQYDQRSKPTVRTLTEVEKAEQEAQRLKEMEERRIQRMKGPQESDEDNEIRPGAADNVDRQGEDDDQDQFGLGTGIGKDDGLRQPLEFEDEDDFLIEDDLIASGSDVEISEVDEPAEDAGLDDADGGMEDDFGKDLMTAADMTRSDFQTKTNVNPLISSEKALAYTYTCPQSHEELQEITKDIPIETLPTVVQRIRVLHSVNIAEGNKQKLAAFSAVLVEHVLFLTNMSECPSFGVLETLLRHIHSLARSYPEDVGRAFRTHLQALHKEHPLSPTPGDLVLLTGVSSIFPTSDHFHQVVTPAILCMGRYLGQKVPQTLSDLATGTYISSLCLQYQRLSKRFIPEVVNFLLNSLWSILPPKAGSPKGYFLYHKAPIALRIRPEGHTQPLRQLKFWDVQSPLDLGESGKDELKQAILHTQLKLVENFIHLWVDKSAFYEAFYPFTHFLMHIQTPSVATLIPPETRILATTLHGTLTSLLSTSLKSRRPLFLHNHRPLAIRSFIPKFEPTFNPTSHYDPDRERAEMQKLQKEHKRERKGALRELRKDARFMAREGLKEKREKDRAYEEKYRKLIASIQGEEGKERNEYERMKRGRKKMKRKGK